EERGRLGIVDRLVVGMREWKGVAGALRKHSLKDTQAGSGFPGSSVLALEAAVSPQALLAGLGEGFTLARDDRSVLSVAKTMTAYSTLSARAGVAPTGTLGVGVFPGSPAVPMGLAGRLRFEGAGGALEGLRDALRFFHVPEPDLAQGIASLPEGRMWVLGGGSRDFPLSLTFLEARNELLVSPDAAIPSAVAALAPENSLRANPSYAAVTAMEDCDRCLVLYVSPDMYDVAFRITGLLIGGLRGKVMNIAGGFDPLAALGAGKDLSEWSPSALLVGYDRNTLELRLVSPTGLAVPLCAAFLAEELRHVDFTGGRINAPAGLVSDLGVAPAVDGTVEQLYARGLVAPLGSANKALDSGSVSMFTSGGMLYIGGYVPIAADGGPAGAEIIFSTGAEFSENGFRILLAEGAAPAFSFRRGEIPWAPAAAFAQQKTPAKWTFEMAIPLTHFFIDPAAASPVWRTVIVARSGGTSMRWGEADSAPGYLVFNAIKGPIPAGVDIDRLLDRRPPAAQPDAAPPAQPPAPEPPIIF
ncbi:MAG: hypothetical protein JW909_00195, partial [Planctomycetes bacterium]|nr:hypothetical protein [Planctomycetota bacterium]